MNLFSGNGESKGLMQRGATSQHLGLYTPSTKEGLMDRMKPPSGDDKSKNDSGSTNNNNGNNNNQGVSLAKGNEGEKTVEKQIGTIKESMDRIEKMLSSGNPPIVPATTNPDRNTSGGNTDKIGNASQHPSFNAENRGTPIPAFNNTLPQGSSGGLSYSKLPTSNPENVSADGQFTKAMVSSPGGGRNVVAWVPSASPDTGTVSTKNIIKHPKKQ